MSFEEIESALKTFAQAENEPDDRDQLVSVIERAKKLVAEVGETSVPASCLNLLNKNALLVLGIEMSAFFERHPNVKDRAYTLVSMSTTTANDLIYMAVCQPGLVATLGLPKELLELLKQDNETRAKVIGTLKTRKLKEGMNAFCDSFRLLDNVSSQPWNVLGKKLTDLKLNEEDMQFVAREIWGKSNPLRQELAKANFPGELIDELESMGIEEYSDLSRSETKAMKSRYQLTAYQQSVLDRVILKSGPFFGPDGKWVSREAQCQEFIDELKIVKATDSEEVKAPPNLLKSLGFGNEDQAGVIKEALDEAIGILDPLPEPPYSSDEEMVATVDDGTALHGVCFGMAIQHNAEEAVFCTKAPKPLFKRPKFCKVIEIKQQNPRKKMFYFTNAQDANDFKKLVFLFGLTFAESLTHRFPSFVQTGSDGSSKTISALSFFVCPILSFQLEREHLKLTNTASCRLEDIRGATDASDFLEEFGSHILCDPQQLGGIACHCVNISLQHDKPSIQLIKLANEQLERGASELKFRPNKTIMDELCFPGDSSTQMRCVYEAENRGPAISKFEVFNKVIKYSPIDWHIIERNIPASIMPIWKWVAKQMPEKKSQADLLRDCWLEKVAPLKTETTVAREIAKTASGFKEQRNEDRKNRIASLLDRLGIYTDQTDYLATDDAVSKDLEEFFQLWSSAKSFPDKERASQFSRFLSFVAQEARKNSEALSKTIKFLKRAIDSELTAALKDAGCPLDTLVEYLLKPSQKDAAERISLHNRLEKARIENLSALLEEDYGESEAKGQEVWQWRINVLVNAALQAEDVTNPMRNALFKLLTENFFWVDGAFQYPLDKETLRKLIEDIEGLAEGKHENEVKRAHNELQNEIEPALDVSDDNEKVPEKTNLNVATSSNSKQNEETIKGLSATPFKNLKEETNQCCGRISYEGLATKTFDFEDPARLARIEQSRKKVKKSFFYFLTDFPLDECSVASNGRSQLKNELMRCLRSRLSLDVMQKLLRDEQICVYDVLLELIDDYGTPGVSEMYQLLLERRCMVPIFNPLTNEHYLRLLRQVPYVTDPSEPPINLGNDTSLYRIAVISYCPLEESQMAELIYSLFRINSFHVRVTSSDYLTKEALAIDVGVGYISGTQFKGRARSGAAETNQANSHVMVVQLIGDIEKACEFVREFADLLLVEDEDGLFHSRIKRKEADNLIGDSTQVVVWTPTIKGLVRSSIGDNQKSYGFGIISVKSPQGGMLVNELSSILSEAISQFGRTRQQGSRKRLSEFSLFEKHAYSIEGLVPFDTDATLNASVKSVAETRRRFVLQLNFREQFTYEEQRNEYRLEKAKVEEARGKILECFATRKREARHVEGIGLIKTLVNLLEKKDSSVRVMALRQLEMGLSTRTELELKALQNEINFYYEQIVGGVTKASKESDENSNLNKLKYAEAKKNYREAMLHLEHVWRELSHLYVSDPNMYPHLPKLAAQHLFDGFSIELLDGDANMMNLDWITAVLVALNNLMDKEKNNMFVLSVMGVQSSGKSTLLNTMFGIKMRTSVGQCTRGINMQLIPVEGRKEYDYVLVLDTEGTRSPDFYGMAGNEKRDNQMATLSILLADATIVVNPGENDAAVKEILPIVLLAYQGSKLAEDNGGRLSSKMFFVYNRIDTTQKEKLTNIIQTLANSLMDAFRTVREMGGCKIDGNSPAAEQPNCLFRHFKLDASNSADSDVRIIGQNKISFTPPDNTPHPDYGASLVEFREHIHRRVTETKDGAPWVSRSPLQLSEYTHQVWKCICSSDFNLQFTHVLERATFDQLEADYQKVKHELASEYQQQYVNLRKAMISMRGNVEQETNVDSSEYINTMLKNMSKLITDLNERMKDITSMKGREKWRLVYQANWETCKSQQKEYWRQQLRTSFDAIFVFDKELENLKKSMREEISNMYKDKDPESSYNETELNETFNGIMKEYVRKAEEKYPSINVIGRIAAVYGSSVIIIRHAGIDVFDAEIEMNCKNYLVANVSMPGQQQQSQGQAANKLSILGNLLKSCIKWGMSKWEAAKRSNKKELEEKNAEHVAEVVKALVLCLKKIDETVNIVLAGVACYDDSIVHSMIEKTDHILHNNVRRIDFTHRAYAHTYTRIVLERFLPEIQSKWESVNSVPSKFGSEENKKEMRDFFFMAARGANKMKLFGFLIKQKFVDLENAFQAEMVAQTVEDIKRHRWLYDFRSTQNLMDEHLVELIDDENVPKLIEYIKNPDELLKEVLLRLIASIARDMLVEEKGWNNFKDTLKNKIRSATADALEATEKRASRYLKSLQENLLSSLKSDAIGQSIAIDLGDSYAELDDDVYKEEFKKACEEDIIMTITKQTSPTRNNEFSRCTAKLVIDQLRKENAAGAMPRCEACCPWCSSMCTLEAGHNLEEMKHNSLHQPAGLAGVRYICKKTLTPTMCSNYTDSSVLVLKAGTDEEVRFSFREWCDHFPDWTKPHNAQEWPLREYIFYNYHEEFAKYYGVNPCDDMIPDYNRDLRVIRQKLRDGRVGGVALYEEL